MIYESGLLFGATLYTDGIKPVRFGTRYFGDVHAAY